MRTTRRTPLLLLGLLALAGCASLPPGTQRSDRDPWERMNRATYKFNDKLDKAVLRPVARGYQKAVPRFMRTGFRNFMSNLAYPVTMLNDLLQGQFRAFGNDTARFLMNTTLGLGGLLDPATTAGLDKNSRDFGQTLGKWGVHTGPYLVLPLLGPSDVRDGFGRLADEYSDPRHYIKNQWWNWGLWTVDKIDGRAQLMSANAALDSSYDPYSFVRNVYLQHRDFMVNGSSAREQDAEEQRLYDEAEKDMNESSSGAAPEKAPPAKEPATPPEPPPTGAPPEAQPPPQ